MELTCFDNNFDTKINMMYNKVPIKILIDFQEN